MMGGELDAMNQARSGICQRALKDVFREAYHRRKEGTSVAVRVRMQRFFRLHT